MLGYVILYYIVLYCIVILYCIYYIILYCTIIVQKRGASPRNADRPRSAGAKACCMTLADMFRGPYIVMALYGHGSI